MRLSEKNIKDGMGVRMNYTVFMTNKCNLDCTYCYEKNKQDKSITKEVLDALIKEISEKENDDVSVVIHGGEPLLEFKKIKYLIDELKKSGKRICYSVTTNGTLLNRENIDYLIREVDNISISIDGEENSHDKNRHFKDGRGSYEIIDKNINKYLMENKNNIKARMTINRYNYENISKNIIHLIEKGFSDISPVINQFDVWEEEQWKVIEEELKIVETYILEKKIDVKVGLIDDAKHKCKNSACNGGTSTITIDTDGKIYPCIIVNGLKEYCIGNIFEGINKSCLKNIHKNNNEKVDCCEGCARYDYCEATRCKIINKYQTGKWNQPSINVCMIQNLKISLAENLQK